MAHATPLQHIGDFERADQDAMTAVSPSQSLPPSNPLNISELERHSSNFSPRTPAPEMTPAKLLIGPGNSKIRLSNLVEMRETKFAYARRFGYSHLAADLSVPSTAELKHMAFFGHISGISYEAAEFFRKSKLID